jgi:predicted lactoylglutathione lyase
MKKTKIMIAVAVILIVIFIFNNQQDYDEFTKCLTEKGISMGGTEWCSHCKNQKEMFGSSFQYVDYHDCDLEQEWCTEKGITGYPTWILSDGSKHPGEQKLSTLAELSGCEI